MENTTLNARDWIEIFIRVSRDIEARESRLNELDENGRLGTAMAGGFRAVRDRLSALDGNLTIDQVFQAAGGAFAAAGGTVFGPLVGAMWSQVGRTFAGRTSFGAEEAVWMLEAMEEVLTSSCRAGRGGKAMLNALGPAVKAAQAAKGEELDEVLRRAADAVRAGTRMTVPPEKDNSESAGAAGMALILGSFHQTVADLACRSRGEPSPAIGRNME